MCGWVCICYLVVVAASRAILSFIHRLVLCACFRPITRVHVLARLLLVSQGIELFLFRRQAGRQLLYPCEGDVLKRGRGKKKHLHFQSIMHKEANMSQARASKQVKLLKKITSVDIHQSIRYCRFTLTYFPPSRQ